jgi:hypothetical protein
VLRAIPNNERVVREIAFRVFRFKGSSRSSELAQARSSRNSPPRGRRKPYDTVWKPDVSCYNYSCK